ncbi:MAG: hypothetical protein AseanaTS_07410 [Candidatus Pelagadaptatus aseana]
MLLLTFALSEGASASPASVQVCVQIFNDGDVNQVEGGFFTLSIMDHQNSLIPEGALEINKIEDAKRTPSCTQSYLFTADSNALSVHEMTPVTFEWMCNAPGYPIWQITDAAGKVVWKQGSDYTAALSAEEFAQIPQGSDLRVIYINKPRWYEKEDGDVVGAASLTADLEAGVLGDYLSGGS